MWGQERACVPPLPHVAAHGPQACVRHSKRTPSSATGAALLGGDTVSRGHGMVSRGEGTAVGSGIGSVGGARATLAPTGESLSTGCDVECSEHRTAFSSGEAGCGMPKSLRSSRMSLIR